MNACASAALGVNDDDDYSIKDVRLDLGVQNQKQGQDQDQVLALTLGNDYFHNDQTQSDAVHIIREREHETPAHTQDRSITTTSTRLRVSGFLSPTQEELLGEEERRTRDRRDAAALKLRVDRLVARERESAESSPSSTPPSSSTSGPRSTSLRERGRDRDRAPTPTPTSASTPTPAHLLTKPPSVRVRGDDGRRAFHDFDTSTARSDAQRPGPQSTTVTPTERGELLADAPVQRPRRVESLKRSPASASATHHTSRSGPNNESRPSTSTSARTLLGSAPDRDTNTNGGGEGETVSTISTFEAFFSRLRVLLLHFISLLVFHFAFGVLP